MTEMHAFRAGMAPRTTEVRGSASAGHAAGTLPTILVLLALATAAWVATVIRMAGMDAGPGTEPGSLGFYASTWTVMIIAMMLPSALPPVLAQPDGGRRAAFAAGYLATWALAGLLGYAALKLGRQLDGGFFVWHRAGRATAAAVLVLAAAYELTPAKRRFLAGCRTRGPAAERPRSALRLGIANGGACLGCCGGLMVALFALGEMSITWMVVLTVVIAVQKLLPWRAAMTATAATLLLALGTGVAASPARVPGLTVPGGSAANHAMRGMQS